MVQPLGYTSESTNHYLIGPFYNYAVDNRLAEKADYKDGNRSPGGSRLRGWQPGSDPT
jgi:hypothetical protein